METRRRDDGALVTRRRFEWELEKRDLMFDVFAKHLRAALAEMAWNDEIRPDEFCDCSTECREQIGKDASDFAASVIERMEKRRNEWPDAMMVRS